MQTVLYKRSMFVTHLPVAHLYTQSHSWIAPVQGKHRHWRVGYTKFALRMLGELVEVQFEQQQNTHVKPGDILGNVEGFKAISDIYCVGEGQFFEANPGLAKSLEPLEKSPYDEGWLYEFAGEPDSRAMNVQRYRELLDSTIDRMLQKEEHSKKTE